jgi:hypothetical protein
MKSHTAIRKASKTTTQENDAPQRHWHSTKSFNSAAQGFCAQLKSLQALPKNTPKVSPQAQTAVHRKPNKKRNFIHFWHKHSENRQTHFRFGGLKRR